MKKLFTLILALFVVSTAFAQQVTEAEVPTPAVEAFKKEFPTLPDGIKPSWNLDKAVGSDKALYKVSWMIPGGFVSHIYNMNGQKVYTIRDYYKPADAPQNVVTNMKAAYTSSPLTKVSEFISDKYGKKGYLIKYDDFKTKYADAAGNASSVNPLNDILKTADADITNFTATTVSPNPGTKVAPGGAVKPPVSKSSGNN